MNAESTPKCPQCGAPLPPDAPDGLCPKCVMALNLKTETIFSAESAPPHAPLTIEQIAPHFPQLEILEYLGRGGMGVVYKARQKSLNRLVALKLLAPERVHDPEFAARFTREAQALAALNHPNIVTIHDFGRADLPVGLGTEAPPQQRPTEAIYYFVMEFVDGVNLRHLLRARKFTPEEALAVVPPLCDALQYAHERGIVHRDIKPENILLDKAGRVKVADFGIAKIVGTERGSVSRSGGDDSSAFGGTRAEMAGNVAAGHSPAVQDLTETHQTFGTPGYSAPEQKTDPQRVDSRADIYSLGVVFYEMLTGELPGKRIEPPSKKVHIDVRLDEIVLRALETKPELRYQQASVLKTQVETIAESSAAPGTDQHNADTGWKSPDSGWGWLVGRMFGVTFTSLVAYRIANASAIGFLGFLGYIPGGRAFFGFFGFFGLAGLAFILESLRRNNAAQSTAPSPAPPADFKCPITMEKWLTLMDTGEYGQSWDVAAQYFQKQITKEEWVKRLEHVRRPLGEIRSRKAVSIQNTVFGSRYEAKYLSAFDGLPTATETVTYAKQFSGEWLPVGYLIKPGEEKTSAQMHRPWQLVVVALLFIIFGLQPVWDAAKAISAGGLPFNPGLLSLPAGVGLLRLRPWWRKTAVFMLLFCFAILAVAAVFALSGAPLTTMHGAFVFGIWIKNPIFGGITMLVLLIISGWQYAVLIRPDVKVLFKKRGFSRPLIEWGVLLGMLGISSVGFALLGNPHDRQDFTRTLASGLPIPHPTRVRQVNEAPFVAQLANGGKLELLAVRLNSSTNLPWWQPNGLPSHFGSDIQPASQAQYIQHKNGVVAIMREDIPPHPDYWPRANSVWGEGVTFKNAREGFGTSNQRLSNGELAVYFEEAPSSGEETTLSLKLTTAQWQPLLTIKPGFFNAVLGGFSESPWSFSHTSSGDLKVFNPRVAIDSEHEYRLAAVDVDGKEYLPNETTWRPSENFATFEAIFVRLPAKSVREVRWEARSYETIEFQNVSIKPGHRTTVVVKDFGGENQVAPAMTGSSTAVSNIAFGQMVERTLSDAQSAEEPGLLNLETGQRLTRSEIFGTNRLTSRIPIALTESGAAAALESRGVEIGGNVNSTTPGLYAWNCSVYGIGSSGWDAADEPNRKQSGWDKSLQDIFNGLPEPLSGSCNILSGNPPQTWLLKTKRGVQAVVQITGFTENPRGVKIRYKLVLPRNVATHIYSIERGDTAVGIARKFGMSVADLKALNPNLNWTRIRVGQEARVYGEEPRGAETNTAARITDNSARHEFEFRWVAANDDTTSPADELTSTRSNGEGERIVEHYRVLRDVVLSDRDVESAGFSEYQSSQKTLEVFLYPGARERFAEATAQHIGRQLAIVWRSNVISAPIIQSALPGGRVRISGNFSDAEAKELLDLLNHRTTHAKRTDDVSAALVEEPKLQFLAWQDEWQTNAPFAARHPDGSAVTNQEELDWLRAIPFPKNSSNPGDLLKRNALTGEYEKDSRDYRVLNLWFAHPQFDDNSLSRVDVLIDGQFIPTTIGAGFRRATAANGNLGWECRSVLLDGASRSRGRAALRLSYRAGPMEKTWNSSANEGVYAREGDGYTIVGIGNTADGKASISFALDLSKMSGSVVGAMAVTKNGKELQYHSWKPPESGTTGVATEKFEFDAPLADVAKFIIGTRPIRTMEWKDVILPK